MDSLILVGYDEETKKETAKQCLRIGTKVFYSLHFQLKHDFLEIADTVKMLTAVIYMDGYFSL